MTDRENVITHLQIIETWSKFACKHDLQFFTEKHLEDIAQLTDDAVAMLKKQDAKIKELSEELEDVYKNGCTFGR